MPPTTTAADASPASGLKTSADHLFELCSQRFRPLVPGAAPQQPARSQGWREDMTRPDAFAILPEGILLNFYRVGTDAALSPQQGVQKPRREQITFKNMHSQRLRHVRPGTYPRKDIAVLSSSVAGAAVFVRNFLRRNGPSYACASTAGVCLRNRQGIATLPALKYDAPVLQRTPRRSSRPQCCGRAHIREG